MREDAETIRVFESPLYRQSEKKSNFARFKFINCYPKNVLFINFLVQFYVSIPYFALIS